MPVQSLFMMTEECLTNLRPLSTAFIAYIIFPPLSSSFRLVFPNVFNNDLELFLKLSTLFGLLLDLLDGAHDG